MEKTLWEQVVGFHGHSCIGLAMGYRVAEAAMRALGNSRDVDEEMVAIVENDSCAVDAIQVVTGCTLGKGNLIFRDYGKQAYTFVLREKGKAVRVTVKSPDEKRHREIMALREKAAAGEATEEEKGLLKSKTAEVMNECLSAPLEEVVEVKEVDCVIPEKARIFSSVTCSCCGEKVMEPRARVKDGQVTCIPCAENYTRGWGES
jgi:formylmethanofuran dehydrogenase subunit E